MHSHNVHDNTDQLRLGSHLDSALHLSRRHDEHVSDLTETFSSRADTRNPGSRGVDLSRYICRCEEFDSDSDYYQQTVKRDTDCFVVRARKEAFGVL